MFEVEISSMSPERFRSVLKAERFEAFERGVRDARELLAGRVVWNINSTARGGGVAELLQSLVAYARGAGVDVRWTVIEGTADFFAVTKRIHNRLHGAMGDGGALDDAARAVYEQVLADNLPALSERVRPGDVAIVHDPQPAGLIAALRAAGAAVIWRCHVGLDHPSELAREAWDFLGPYLLEADAFVFSRESFAWECLDRERIFVIAPSIDVFSPKNADLDRETARGPARQRAALRRREGGALHVQPAGRDPFSRRPPCRGDRRRAPRRDDSRGAASLTLGCAQGSPRGDPRVRPARARGTGSHLLYAGPAVTAVADDPEGLKVLREARALRENLPAAQRRRIHLASLPMDDPAENAIMVNPLQRHVNVIVQKSLAEGFGLTVAEAMWKARPVVASRIGGIQSQIINRETGILLDDPRDLRAFGEAVTGLLLDPERAELLGQRARQRVRDEFTSPRSLLDYLRLIRQILERSGVRAAA